MVEAKEARKSCPFRRMKLSGGKDEGEGEGDDDREKQPRGGRARPSQGQTHEDGGLKPRSLDVGNGIERREEERGSPGKAEGWRRRRRKPREGKKRKGLACVNLQERITA